MPITYSIDHERMLILSEGLGVVKANELCIYYSRMADDTPAPQRPYCSPAQI